LGSVFLEKEKPQSRRRKRARQGRLAEKKPPNYQYLALFIQQLIEAKGWGS
jgi:hypothetical protein